MRPRTRPATRSAACSEVTATVEEEAATVEEAGAA
jgi:hypothetical protein